jgi:hypothetical protein
MARLPQVGGDNGSWGDVLNEYLSQSLSADGSLNVGTVGSVQLRPNAVTSDAITNGSISNAKIADGAVNTAQIADNSVTPSKISGLGAVDGVASLDASGRLHAGELPTWLTEAAIASSTIAAVDTAVFVADSTRFAIDVSGDTPSQTGINAALNAAPQGATVKFPQGARLRITGGITIPASKRLSVDFSGVTLVRDYSGTMITCASSISSPISV